jgi:hypothetical protein
MISKCFSSRYILPALHCVCIIKQKGPDMNNPWNFFRAISVILFTGICMTLNAQIAPQKVSFELVFSTYLGGRNYDDGPFLALDPEGNIYLSGNTLSSDFPVTPNAYRKTMYSSSTEDLVITRMKPDGSGLDYSTFLGGTDYDGHDYFVTIDTSGCFYFSGMTSSRNYPMTNDAYDKTYNGGDTDIFITVMNPTGTGLVYSTFLGGNKGDSPAGLSRDNEGNLYICGNTKSANFPITSGAYDVTFNNTQRIFLAKLNPTAKTLVYSTFLPGTDFYHDDMLLDHDGGCFFCPYNATAGLPTTPGAISDTFRGGAKDIYLGKMNPSGTSLEFATYLGGNADDETGQMCLDNDGNLWMVGMTRSTDFPVTDQTNQTIDPQEDNVFLAKIDSDNGRLVMCTILPGVKGTAWDLTMSGEDKLLAVVLETEYSGLPITSHAIDSTNRGESDAYLAIYNNITMDMIFGTYIGGAKSDFPFSANFDAAGNLVMCGGTFSTDFPLKNAFQTRYKGGYKDGFVVKFIKTKQSKIDEDIGTPQGFQLKQNYPNPFNPTTTIRYSLDKPSLVKVGIYNLAGREIKKLIAAFQRPGDYSLVWDATDDHNVPVATGIYFCKTEVENLSVQKKMLLVR